MRLVGRLRCVRGLPAATAVVAACAARRRRPRGRLAEASRTEPPPTFARQALWCTLAATGIAAAACRQQPHHAERRVGAAAVDRAAHDLPRDFHPVLRRARAGTARPVPRRTGGGTRRHGLDARRLDARARPRAANGVFCVGLFLACMFCHGELVRLKPAPRYLTRFYLMVSLGGALGAALVGIVAPMRPARGLRAGRRPRAVRAAPALAGAPRAARVSGARRSPR